MRLSSAESQIKYIASIDNRLLWRMLVMFSQQHNGTATMNNFANYAEFHVYEKVAVLRDGRRLSYVGTISPAVINAMRGAGVKIR